jgi:hypothetical protein
LGWRPVRPKLLGLLRRFRYFFSIIVDMRIKRKSLLVWGSKIPLLLLPLFPVGCISVPQPNSSENLSSHVRFLASSELKGRAPGSQGSRAAREYIATRFRAAGLRPWPGEKKFQQSFGYGQNVIGILPGADPVLSNEVVVVSAHYDHLGKKNGRIHPGAADNAAGVAALLDVLRQLAASGHPAKRTIAFAAFDCEEWMLFGSFAFALRKDVKDARIAAVVNADMLGRDFMDVVPHTLFLAGAEDYPELRQQIRRSGEATAMRILPLGTDLVGPRSDHVAFESRDIPCLFFSSGTFKDYHDPTDTADKLNYSDLEKSAKVLRVAVETLANAAEISRIATRDPGAFGAEELQTIQTVMREVMAHREQAGVSASDAKAFEKLAGKAERLLQSGHYDREARAGLLADATAILAPYFLPVDPDNKHMTEEEQKEMATWLPCLQQFYSLHRKEVMASYSELVKSVLKHRPGAFRSMPVLDREFYSMDDDDIRYVQNANGSCSLHAMGYCFNLRAGSRKLLWFVNGFGMSMSLSYVGADCKGTRREISDFCLLRLRSYRSNEVCAAQTRKLIEAVNGTNSMGGYPQLLEQRLASGGFKDEIDWIVSCLSSRSPDLAMEALSAYRNVPRVREAVCKIVRDRNIRSDVRAKAIKLIAKSKDKNCLFALCDVLDDPAPQDRLEYCALFDSDFPFANRVFIQSVRPLVEQRIKDALKRSATIGELARSQLKKAAGRDLGADPASWREWIKTVNKV